MGAGVVVWRRVSSLPSFRRHRLRHSTTLATSSDGAIVWPDPRESGMVTLRCEAGAVPVCPMRRVWSQERGRPLGRRRVVRLLVLRSMLGKLEQCASCCSFLGKRRRVLPNRFLVLFCLSTHCLHYTWIRWSRCRVKDTPFGLQCVCSPARWCRHCCVQV